MRRRVRIAVIGPRRTRRGAGEASPPPDFGCGSCYGRRGWLRWRAASVPAPTMSAITVATAAPMAASPQSKPLPGVLAVGDLTVAYALTSAVL